MAALPLGVAGAAASPLNPEQTIIKPPDALAWKGQLNFPPNSVDNCTLTGDTSARPLIHACALASGVHERPAFLFDRPPLHGAVGHMVVQQGCRLRSCGLRAGVSWQLRASRRLDAAL